MLNCIENPYVQTYAEKSVNLLQYKLMLVVTIYYTSIWQSGKEYIVFCKCAYIAYYIPKRE